MVLTSLLSGLRTVWANRFLVGMMFLFKLGSSLLLFFPLYLMLSSSFARSVTAARFLSGIDLSLIIDFIYRWREALPVYLVTFGLVCCLLVVVFIFLSGGFWGLLRDDLGKRPTCSKMERFFGYAGKHFWGMLKIALLLAVLYFTAFLVFVVFNAVLRAMVGKVSLEDLSSWRILSRVGVAVFLFFLVNMIGDYLRISLVENHGERFFDVMGTALKFLLTNFWRALSLYYLLSLLLAGLILAYIGLGRVMNGLPDTGFLVFLVFLVQQVFVLFRSFGRLVCYCSQLAFYQQRSKAGSAAV